MHNLRDALGKQDDLDIGKPFTSNSIHTHKNNNSQSMWSIGVGSDDQQGHDVSLREVERLQKLIDQVSVFKGQDRLVNQELVKQLMRSQEKYLASQRTEKQKIQEIEKKLSQTLIKASIQLQRILSLNSAYISKLIQVAKEMKKKIKSKNSNAKEFDDIGEKIFKKPSAKMGTKQNKRKILQVNLLPDSGTRNVRKSKKNHDSNGTKNSGSGSQESGEGKLGKLLSSDKYEKKKSGKQEEERQSEAPEESYTFSAVFNATTVRQRPRIGKKQKDMVDMTNAKKKMNEEDEIIGNDREDDAFIFFRPKRSRR